MTSLPNLINCFGVALLHLATATSLGNRFVSHWERCRSDIADASLSLDVNGLLVLCNIGDTPVFCSGGGMNLPHHVPISLDGEEGYSVAQRRLNYNGCDREVNRESVHPPPNRTVFDSETPPPYRARRFTHPPGGGSGGVGGGNMDSKHHAASATKMPTQVNIGNGGSPVVRCYNGGLSNNNNINNVNLNSNSSGLSPLPVGRAGGAVTHHPSYQYHPPHAPGGAISGGHATTAHNGHLRAPLNNHNNHRRESPTSGGAKRPASASGHSRHSSSSSSNSARSSLGSPPNYNDVIANNFTRHSNGADIWHQSWKKVEHVFFCVFSRPLNKGGKK